MVSAVWAAGLSIPISLLGAAVSFGLAHSDGLVMWVTSVLFFPFLVFSVFADTYLPKEMPGFIFGLLALLSQFLGYFLAILLIRTLYRHLKVRNPTIPSSGRAKRRRAA